MVDYKYNGFGTQPKDSTPSQMFVVSANESRYSNRAVKYSNKAFSRRGCALYTKVLSLAMPLTTYSYNNVVYVWNLYQLNLYTIEILVYRVQGSIGLRM